MEKIGFFLSFGEKILLNLWFKGRSIRERERFIKIGWLESFSDIVFREIF